MAHLQPRLFTFPFTRAALREEFSRRPDGPWQDFPRFLLGVRAHTRPGDTIAVVAPRPHWPEGDAYVRCRAAYFLTGRKLLPPGQARYAAFWRAAPPPQTSVVWSGDGGVLTRR